MAATNGVEVRVAGLSRSGNHCLIDWLLRQIEGRWCFLNCAEGKTNPFLTARPADDGVAVRTNIPDFDLEAERRGRLSRKDWLVHSYEDSFLGHALRPGPEVEREQMTGRSGRHVDLLVLRDPLNLFASRRALRSRVSDRTAIRIWKQHARAALHPSALLRHETVIVPFDHFVGSSAFRGALAERLGLRLRDSSLSRVAACAGGSSFDGMRFDGQAERMAVGTRWRSAVDDPAWRALFDRETEALARKLFPDAPASVAEAERYAKAA